MKRTQIRHRPHKEAAARSTGQDKAEPRGASPAPEEIHSTSVCRAPARRQWLILVPVLLSICVSWNSVGNGFTYDDEFIVEQNDMITDLGRTGEIFRSNYWASLNRNRGLYRPLVMFSFALNHSVHGLEPVGYHLVNILLNALVAGLVFALMRRLSRSSVSAVVAGSIFAVHPIHVEAVANVVGRAELLSALFSLLTLVLYLRARDAAGLRRWIQNGLGALFFFAALLSKENAVTFLAAPILFEACMSRTPRRIWRDPRSNLGAYAVLLPSVFLYLFIRTKVVGVFAPPDIAFSDNPLIALSAWPRQVAALTILGRYVTLFAWPDHMSADYGYSVLPLSGFTGSPLFWAGLAFLLLSAGLAVFWYRRGNRCELFCLLLFFATYSIISNTVLVIGTPIAERLFYAPSISLCLLVGFGIQKAVELVATRPRPRFALLTAVLILLALPLSARTCLRNRVWRSNLELFRTDAESNPASVKLQLKLGYAYIREDMPEQALPALQRAVDTLPSYSHAYMGLALAYEALGDDENMRMMVKKALEVGPRNVQAVIKLGVLLIQDGNPAEAINVLGRALKQDPASDTARFHLGLAQYNAGNYGAAVEMLAEPVKLSDKQRLDRYYMLGSSCQKLGDNEKAADHLSEGLKYFPDATKLLELLAYIEYADLKRYAPARAHFRRLLELNPDHPRRDEYQRVLDYLVRRGEGSRE